MYNPALPPYVSHIEGNRLINAYIETYVCPTTTSDTILGGEPFRFAEDVSGAADDALREMRGLLNVEKGGGLTEGGAGSE